LEKTSKIIKSNCQPITTMPARACTVLNPHGCSTEGPAALEKGRAELGWALGYSMGNQCICCGVS